MSSPEQNITYVDFSGGGQSAAYYVSGDGSGGGGMDAWQTSVENRLGTLDNRLGRIEDRTNTISSDLAGLRAKVDTLPSKGFIVGIVLSSLTVIAAVVAFIDNIHKIFK